jgi:hypothetical protein
MPAVKTGQREKHGGVQAVSRRTCTSLAILGETGNAVAFRRELPESPVSGEIVCPSWAATYPRWLRLHSNVPVHPPVPPVQVRGDGGRPPVVTLAPHTKASCFPTKPSHAPGRLPRDRRRESR